MFCCSQLYSLLSSASPPLLLGNLPWVRLNSFTASRIASHSRLQPRTTAQHETGGDSVANIYITRS